MNDISYLKKKKKKAVDMSLKFFQIVAQQPTTPQSTAYVGPLSWQYGNQERPVIFYEPTWRCLWLSLYVVIYTVTCNLVYLSEISEENSENWLVKLESFIGWFFYLLFN